MLDSFPDVIYPSQVVSLADIHACYRTTTGVYSNTKVSHNYASSTVSRKAEVVGTQGRKDTRSARTPGQETENPIQQLRRLCATQRDQITSTKHAEQNGQRDIGAEPPSRSDHSKHLRHCKSPRTGSTHSSYLIWSFSLGKRGETSTERSTGLSPSVSSWASSGVVRFL